jgi:hypothetical protein
MISPQTSRSMTFATGVDDSDEDSEEVTDEFAGQADFWGALKVTSASISISGTYSDRDGNQLLKRKRVKVSRNSQRILRVKSSDPNQVIIGF